MDTTSIIQANTGNEWIYFILSFVLLIGLYFIQKHLYQLDHKFSEFSKSEQKAQTKPWPLYVGITLGLLVFLYNFFSPHDIDMKNWGSFEAIIFGLTTLTIVGICFESIRLLTSK